MDKLTKIIATIGPACDSDEQISRLIQNGVNIFRFNFKHNTVIWHSERIQRVNNLAKSLGKIVGTLIDLQGPEIRIKMPFANLELKEGELIILSEAVFLSKKKGFSVSHPSIIEHLKEGQIILADDGVFAFEVIKSDKNECLLKIVRGGILGNNKTLNFPGASFPLPVLIKRDLEGLKLASSYEVDYVALSFVRTANDIQTLRETMRKYKISAQIVAKIETESAINNLEEIVKEADALMVARGDLGVEMSVEKVPYLQKLIIEKCLINRKPVITATQMLQSMIDKPFPTRAEVSDVANAVYDYTDAVMLSAESASGSYPGEAVKVMAKTTKYIEQNRQFVDIRNLYSFKVRNLTEVLCDAAYNMFCELLNTKESIKAIVVFTKTGNTAKLLSGYHFPVPIFAVCLNKKVADSLAVCFGIFSLVQNKVYEERTAIASQHLITAIQDLSKNKLIYPGDKIIVLHGDVWNIEGRTSTIKVLKV